MQLKTACPNCDKSLRVAEALISKSVRCPACQKPFVVAAVGFVGSTSISPDASFVETRAGGALVGTDDAEKQTSTPASASKSIRQLGRFAVSEVLGSGAFGVVYRAFDPALDRQIALKVPRFSNLSDRKVQRFLTEAKSAGRLRHPNIVPVYESGVESGKYFIAYEYVQGQVMSARIRDGVPDLRQAVTWIRDLALALAYAHEQGVIHRDVKPDNIMIDARQSPQLLDFGLARQVSDDSHMTVDGSVIGTPAYMSPEQARGDIEQIGPPCDQYSLGVVLYEVLTGRRPFEGSSHLVIQQVIGTEPPAPRSLRPEVPQDLDAICLKAMDKEPAHRYASCEALADDLDRWLRDEAVQVHPLTSRQRLARFRRRNPMLAILLVCVSLLLFVSAGGGVAAAILVSRSRSDLTTALNGVKEQTRRASEQTARVQTATAAAKEKTQLASTAAQRADTQRLAAETALRDLEEAITQRKAAEEQLQSTVAAKTDAEQSAKEAVEMTKTAANSAKTFEKLVEDGRFPKYLELLAEAQACLKRDDRPAAASILEKCEIQFRGWEWRFLKKYATAKDPDKHIWFLGPNQFDYLKDSPPIAISPDGMLLAFMRGRKPFHYPEVWSVAAPGPPQLVKAIKSDVDADATGSGFLFSRDGSWVAHLRFARNRPLINRIEVATGTKWINWKGSVNWESPKWNGPNGYGSDESRNAYYAYLYQHKSRTNAKAWRDFNRDLSPSELNPSEQFLTEDILGVSADGLLRIDFPDEKPTEVKHLMTNRVGAIPFCGMKMGWC